MDDRTTTNAIPEAEPIMSEDCGSENICIQDLDDESTRPTIKQARFTETENNQEQDDSFGNMLMNFTDSALAIGIMNHPQPLDSEELDTGRLPL
jgi:hypothetical protein